MNDQKQNNNLYPISAIIRAIEESMYLIGQILENRILVPPIMPFNLKKNAESTQQWP